MNQLQSCPPIHLSPHITIIPIAEVQSSLELTGHGFSIFGAKYPVAVVIIENNCLRGCTPTGEELDPKTIPGLQAIIDALALPPNRGAFR